MVCIYIRGKETKLIDYFVNEDKYETPMCDECGNKHWLLVEFHEYFERWLCPECKEIVEESEMNNFKIEFICEVINRSKAMQVSMLMIKLINGCILYNCHRINKLCKKITIFRKNFINPGKPVV